MNNQRKRSIPARVGRILLKTALFFIAFIVLVFLLLLTAPVQRYVTGRVESYLRQKLHSKVEIGRISFGLSGNVSLHNVYIEDLHRDTLLSGGTIRAQVNILKLFSNNIKIKNLELRDVTAKLKRELPDTVFNFQFVVNAFTPQTQSADTTKADPVQIDIKTIGLNNVHLIYTDVLTGNDVDAHIGNAAAIVRHFDPYNMEFDVPGILAHEINASIKQTQPLAAPIPAVAISSESKSNIKLKAGAIDLGAIDFQYDNSITSSHADIHIGQLNGTVEKSDLDNNSIYLDELAMSNSTISYLIKNRPISADNINETKQNDAETWNIAVKKLQLANNSIEFDDYNIPILNSGIDYNHLQANELNLLVNDLVINKDSLAGKVMHGSVEERSGFVLNELQGNFLYANNQAYLKDLYIKTPGSEVKREAAIQYASRQQLTDHFDNTVMQLDITDSHVQVKDILAFAPALRSQKAFSDPNDIWTLNIKSNGTTNNLNIDELKFDGFYDTKINAEGSLIGITTNQPSGNFRINNLHTTQTDISLFIGKKLSTKEISLPETVNMNGKISGNEEKLNAVMNISTSEGDVSVNGNFSNMGDPDAATYDAVIRTTNVDLGRILQDPDMYGTFTSNITVKGTGFTKDKVDATFTGNINGMEYNHYHYSDLAVNGNIKNALFNIKADINDPNADIDLAVNGNLSGDFSFRVKGMIDSLKTLPLHFTTDPLIARGKIDGTITKVTKNNVEGNLLITKALFVSGKNRLPLDTIEITNHIADSGSYTRLRSDIANAYISGQYSLASLGNIIQNSIQPYFSVMPSVATVPSSYHFNFSADITYSPVFDAFVPGLSAFEPIHAEGNFSSETGMNFSASTDHLIYGNNQIDQLRLNAFTNANNELRLTANASRLKNGNALDMHNAKISAIAANNDLQFSVSTDDQFARNKYRLAGSLMQPSNGTYVLSLNRDSLLLNYQAWTISRGNRVMISPSAITASDFTLQKDDQQLSLNGSDGTLKARFTQFRLATISGFTGTDSLPADGLINGEIVFTDLMKTPGFTGDLLVNDFSMRNDTIGNVNIKVRTGSNNHYITDASVTGRGNDIKLSGYFAPAGNDILIDMDVDAKQLQLNTVQGAFASVIRDASGAINGKIKITGKLSNPAIAGNMNFNDASFVPAILGSRFRVENEKLSLSNDGLVFDHFTIKDSAGNKLDINGRVITSNFSQYNYDLDINARNFQLMNTEKVRGNIYYGSLNVDARLHVKGTELKPVADGTITINKGTNFSFIVPQPEAGVAERNGVVEFVDMDTPENDSLFLAYDSLNNSGILGLDVTVNIEIKKEAIFNIVVDEANGDFLNVQGEAELSAGIDPSGKITLGGNYTLDQGAYQLTYNFLQRKFEIQKGSTILWTGEPTAAELNVKAVYVAKAAPLDLVADQLPADINRNYYLQKLPFEVHLDMTGELMKPVIAFDILLPEGNYGVSNDIVTAVQSRLSSLRQDQGDINKQVFSLLLLNRFVGENPFAGSGEAFSFNSYARQSVSKLLTEQLNQLAADLVNGVDVNFDVVSTDDYTTGSRMNRTDLNIGLSKRLLNNRLKITVGSNFQLEGPQNSNQQNNNIAGNIAADYQLSKDGRYVLRFYRQNEYQGIVDGYIIETGVRFIFSVDYNRFMQIFRKKRQRTVGKEEAEKTTGL